MDQVAAAYEQVIERFVNWARAQLDIRAAIVLGSRARGDRPADEWSDLDIIVITTDPERYLATTEWLENIGNPWLTFLEPTGTGGDVERRALFEGGLDVDFAITPNDEFEQLVQGGLESAPDVLDIVRRGTRVLLDKDGAVAQLARRARSIETPPPQPPTQAEFLEVVNDFLYHAVWTAKKLRRGELWTAKGCVDSYMKWRCLLRMIEWHARADKGWSYDTWHGGRFLEEWADPRALEGLRGAFAYYEEPDVRHALWATMELFRWLAVETAERLRYPYPTVADERVTELVMGILAPAEQ